MHSSSDWAQAWDPEIVNAFCFTHFPLTCISFRVLMFTHLKHPSVPLLQSLRHLLNGMHIQKCSALKSFVMPHMLSLRDAGCEHYSLIIPRLRPCILHGIQWFSVHIHYQMHGIPSQNLQAILGCSSAIYNATGSKSQL